MKKGSGEQNIRTGKKTGGVTGEPILGLEYKRVFSDQSHSHYIGPPCTYQKRALWRGKKLYTEDVHRWSSSKITKESTLLV